MKIEKGLIMEQSNELTFLEIEDIQKILKIGKNKAYTLCKTDGFPRIKIGNKTLVPKDKFIEWINNNLEKELL